MNAVIELVSEARAELVRRRRESPHRPLYDLLDEINDPEIPVLSIWDLGILQDVERVGGEVIVTITPTYSGCPAMAHIAGQIEDCLRRHGIDRFRVLTRLAPAWTTDLMDAAARARLREYGIAPPEAPRCPQCGSSEVTVVSEFGSTACKALYRCQACAEPFDYFKPLR